MKNSLNEEFLELLDGACSRLNLEYKKTKNIFDKYGHKVLEIEQSDQAEIAEYLLFLDLKVKKEEYADFLRGITPLIVDLFELILAKSCKFKLSDYVSNKSRNGIRQWDLKKLEKNKAVIDALNEKYSNSGGMKQSPIYSDHLVEIIETLSDDAILKDNCRAIRKIEETLRNKAAHDIFAITDEKIKNMVGLNSKGIINLLVKGFRYTNIKITDEFFNSYDKMNEILRERI